MSGARCLALLAAIAVWSIAPASAQVAAADAVERALASPARTLAHRLRDEQREPQRLFHALDLQAGEALLDVGAGGGYLAQIAIQIVGPTGRVDIHNTPGWIAQFPSMAPEHLEAAFDGADSTYLVAPWDELAAPENAYDAIVLGQIYHDVLLEGADIEAVNRNLFEMLKPGGTLVIEDHQADASMPIGKQVGLHRLHSGLVIELMESAGFVLSGRDDIASEHDDLRFNVFRPNLRGRTSRYILAFRKPD